MSASAILSAYGTVDTQPRQMAHLTRSTIFLILGFFIIFARCCRIARTLMASRTARSLLDLPSAIRRKTSLALTLRAPAERLSGALLPRSSKISATHIDNPKFRHGHSPGCQPRTNRARRFPAVISGSGKPGGPLTGEVIQLFQRLDQYLPSVGRLLDCQQIFQEIRSFHATGDAD